MLLPLGERDTMVPPLWHGLSTIFFVEIVTLLAAYGYQYMGGYQPCYLCYFQRVPYFICILGSAILMVLILKKISSGFITIGVMILGLVLLFSFLFGGYHAGVEWKLWKAPAICSYLKNNLANNVQNLYKSFSTGNQIIVPCDEASWRFLGLSFAGWNAAISFFLSGVAFYSVIRAKRQKRKQDELLDK